jgi:hypothetical protein
MVCLLFTVDHKEGALEEVLRIFKSFSISLSRIESRPSKSSKWKYDIVVEFAHEGKEASVMLELETLLARAVSNYKFIEASRAPDNGSLLRNVFPLSTYRLFIVHCQFRLLFA